MQIEERNMTGGLVRIIFKAYMRAKHAVAINNPTFVYTPLANKIYNCKRLIFNFYCLL